MLRKLSTLILLTSTLAIPAASHAACTTGVYFLDLKATTTPPTPFTSLGSNVTFLLTPAAVTVPAAPAACAVTAGTPPWWRATLKVVLPAGCTQANAVVEYEGLPAGWTVDLGDSRTNDGFGGDGGSSPPFNAELQILNENLSVFNGSSNAALVDNLATADLALTDSALKFVVKDQFVSWGNPYTFLQTPKNKMLFDFTDPNDRDPRTIYLGLNQVITGRSDRTGCGARRVLVTFK